MSKHRTWIIDYDKPTRRLLRTITYAARRHKCELCGTIFDCHLCGISDERTHHVHYGQRAFSESTPRLICMDCIVKHDLAVVVVLHYEVSGRHVWNRMGKYVGFYDHVTGKLLGHGTLRRR